MAQNRQRQIFKLSTYTYTHSYTHLYTHTHTRAHNPGCQTEGYTWLSLLCVGGLCVKQGGSVNKERRGLFVVFGCCLLTDPCLLFRSNKVEIKRNCHWSFPPLRSHPSTYTHKVYVWTGTREYVPTFFFFFKLKLKLNCFIFLIISHPFLKEWVGRSNF